MHGGKSCILFQANGITKPKSGTETSNSLESMWLIRVAHETDCIHTGPGLIWTHLLLKMICAAF